MRTLLSFIHSFIHSGHFYSTPSSPLPLRGAPDYSTATAGTGLAQGPYVTARAGVEPTTLSPDLKYIFTCLTSIVPDLHLILSASYLTLILPSLYLTSIISYTFILPYLHLF